MSGVPILHEWMIRGIKAFDPLGEVYWNKRLGSYVYLQRCPGMMFVADELVRGTPVLKSSPLTNYRGLFEYKSKDGVRIEPTPIMTKCLLDMLNFRRNDDPRNKEFDEAEYEKPLDLEPRSFDELIETDEVREYAKDMRDYGFGHKKHFVMDHYPHMPRAGAPKKLILPVE